MEKTIYIYLSGSIRKGRTDPRSGASFWSPENEEEIARRISVPVVLLNPAKTPIKRNDFFANYGCDLFLVQRADLLLADLRAEKGIGVGAELMYARMVNRPVVSWLPPNSYYRRDFVEDVFGEDLSNWVHPFAHGLSDHVGDTLADCCNHINRMMETGSFEKRENLTPTAAVEYFAAQYRAFVEGL